MSWPDQTPPRTCCSSGTGSEVQIALDARELLADHGITARVISMPCRESFAQQPATYRDEVLAPDVRAQVSVEAGIGQGWRDIVGDAGRIVSLEHFGTSADYQRLYHEFGITPQAVAEAAHDSIRDTTGPVRPGGVQLTATPTAGERVTDPPEQTRVTRPRRGHRFGVL